MNNQGCFFTAHPDGMCYVLGLSLPESHYSVKICTAVLHKLFVVIVLVFVLICENIVKIWQLSSAVCWCITQET